MKNHIRHGENVRHRTGEAWYIHRDGVKTLMQAYDRTEVFLKKTDITVKHNKRMTLDKYIVPIEIANQSAK